jgi:hypothetical protein
VTSLVASFPHPPLMAIFLILPFVFGTYHVSYGLGFLLACKASR